jgi:HK97 family phage prohead protease
MTVKRLDIGAFKAAPDAIRRDCVVLRAGAGAPVMGDGRRVTFTFSDGTVDRMGDSIDPEGWELDEFERNAVALWCHDSTQPPIGRAANVRTEKGRLVGDIEFADADTSPFADSIYRLVRGGFLNAVSVGFLPLEYSFVNEKDRPFGIDFKRQSLLEISVCSIPANPNALVEARSAGLDIAPVVAWAQSVLGAGGAVMVPRDLLEETFRAAKTPHKVRQRYLATGAKGGESRWEVGASRELPLDDAEAWDGPAAAKRMLDHAGFDGDHPDPAKARQGFLIHDAANPELRGSYKLPFADIVGGALKAVKGGIRAAASRLPQTDAPQEVLDVAKGVVEHYEKRFGEKSATPAPPSSGAKAGKPISRANEALIREAMDHHASATAVLQKVLDSNDPADPPETPVDAPMEEETLVPVPQTEEEKRQERIREARRLTGRT